MTLITVPRGTYDIMPKQALAWQWLEKKIRQVFLSYGYGEIRTPIFEHTELFQRGIGATTDIVEKEMYTFTDKGGRSITLRPEGTAPVVRAYIEHKLYGQTPVTKLFYIGPMFRQERPQAGRFRQFHQFGVEMIGDASPVADAEVILLAHDLYHQLGLTDLEIHLNSVGCPHCRQEYKTALTAALKAAAAKLCTTCQLRLDRNPLRLLDCKNASCQEIISQVPPIQNYHCADCRHHFDQVVALLAEVDVKYKLSPKLVRGLDYYSRTVFEIINNELGAQNALCGGGRYDGLVEECGGPSVPGVGFASGIERVLTTLEQKGILADFPNHPQFYLLPLGEELTTIAFSLATQLRRAGYIVELGNGAKSLKSQLKTAHKSGAAFAVIIGEDEWQAREVTLKTMADGNQKRYSVDDLLAQLPQLVIALEKSASKEE
ncbi:MAG TPA: histidine--tRNA ligase [Firmicutes bacterium]|jgi:histidyl-tRNA synthetase|nr:histidine--tRNA ligase [Bacillota bacterium]